jgi:chromate transporter
LTPPGPEPKDDASRPEPERAARGAAERGSSIEVLGPAAPGSPRELFVFFTTLALQGFGGVLPVTQHGLVEHKRWLTRENFAELLTVSQVLPGPNVVNLSLVIGDRFFGWRGALAALAGMLTVPLVIVLVLAALYAGVSTRPEAQGAMRGMAAAAAGLVLGSALKLLPALRGHVNGRWLCAATVVGTFAATAIARWPLAWVVLAIGGASFALAWWRSQQARAAVGPRQGPPR